MLISEQSLVETLDGRAGDRRRRSRLFIPHQAVFIPNKPLLNQRLVCSHPADPAKRAGTAYPAADVKGITREMELKLEPARPAVLATGIIDGLPKHSPAQPVSRRAGELHRNPAGLTDGCFGSARVA